MDYKNFLLCFRLEERLSQISKRKRVLSWSMYIQYVYILLVYGCQSKSEMPPAFNPDR